MISIPTDQKTLREFIERRHPRYAEMLTQWGFWELTYRGGRDWFATNLFRYIKEGDKEYGDRLERAFRFNHTKEVVDLVNKYIFKAKIIRNADDAPGPLVDFWKKATLGGLSVDALMKLISAQSSIYGRAWVVVDTNLPAGAAISLADQKTLGGRVYAYTVKPQDVLDLSVDDAGHLNWILIREFARTDADPFYSSGDVKDRYRLWTRSGWALFEVQEPKDKRGKVQVILIDFGNYKLGAGEVPVFPVDHTHSDDAYCSTGLIGDIAPLDRATANYLSNLDAIIQDQTFSQLAMPAQGLLPGDDKYNALVEMGTKRIFLYDGEGNSKPEYISPDPRQAGVILQIINKIIGEIYHTVGMAGERTKQDNAMGIDNSSGVAKAYDFERLNSLLTAKADSLERAEERLAELVMMWHDQQLDGDVDSLIKYPDNFDVRSLYDEFDIAERLSLIEAPDVMRQTQMESVIDKLFPRIAADLKAKMLAELKDWPPKVDPLTGVSAGSGGQQKKNLTLKEYQNRQGQVVGQDSKTAA